MRERPLACLILLGIVTFSAMAAPVAADRQPTASPASVADPSATKNRATPGSRLLLPFYEVDMNDPQGTTTFFAVRNELDVPAEVEVRYFQTNAPQSPQRIEPLTLAAKQVEPANIRLVPNLQVGPDGFARGFVIIEATTPGAVIQGDYFRVTPGEDFATGFRLLNIDPESTDNDLCGLFTMRYLNGGGFDSGTRFIVWVDLDLAPSGSVFDLAAYSEAGGDPVWVIAFQADQVAFEVSAEELLSMSGAPDFGAIEFQFRDGAVGHISAIMSAQGRYSVGLEASCGEF